MTSVSPLDYDRGIGGPPRTPLCARPGLTEDGTDIGTRRLIIRHTACFSPLENALLMTRVELANISISAFLVSSALNHPLRRAVRRPTSNHEDVALLLGRIGQLATAFRNASTLADPQAVETALRDLSELRLLCFIALGRMP